VNLSEKFRRFVILVSIRSRWIHLSTLSKFAGPCMNCLSLQVFSEIVPLTLLLCIRPDLPPEAPSFITRVCGFGFHIRRFHFGQARRALSLQIAQALDALQRVFGCPEMSAV